MTREFVKEEMIYPAPALEAKKEGTVLLSFIVKSDGSVTDLSVEERVSPELDEEAMRIFRKILWYPAEKLGKPIDYRHTFGIKFKVKKYLNYTKMRGYEFFSYPYEPVDTSLVIYERESLDQHPKPMLSTLDGNFSNFLANNLVYPDAAFKQNVSGTVKLLFVIETNGRPSNIRIINAVGGGCTEEAIRVLKLIKWMPGLREGIAVRTFMPLDITFDIAKKSVGGFIPTQTQFQ
jgi:TonB family protein